MAQRWDFFPNMEKCCNNIFVCGKERGFEQYTK